jgi:hypothetical protein
MKNIKEIGIGLFAIIGLTAITMGLKHTENLQETPTNQVWEMVGVEGTTNGAFLYNKVTGEVRMYIVGRDVYWKPKLKE